MQREDVDTDVTEVLSKALKSEKDVEVTIVNYTKNGDRYYNNLQITPVFDDEGKLINFIALQRDITKEMEFKSELLRVNSRFELITSRSNIGVWEWDSATGIAEWNNVLFEQYGRTPSAWTNTNQVEWVASLHPEDRERVLNSNESLVK